MKKQLTLFTILFSAILLTGCVPVWTGSAMQEDIDQLKKGQADLNDNLGEKQQELSGMVEQARKDVAEVKKVLEEATKLLQRNDADFGMEVEQTRMELQRLRGEIEKMSFDFSRLQEDLKLFKEDVDLRFAEGGALKMPDKPKELMKYAKEKFDANDWRSARRAYQTFVTKFPKDSDVAEAQFMAGETLFNEKQWVSAVYEYQKVLQGSKPGSYAGDSAFRIGQSFGKLGKCEQAALFYESVVKDYPKSRFARNAKSELKKAKAGKCD